MTDYRSVERLMVYREDAYVGDLVRLPRGCEFRYTEEFLSSGQPAIALHLPKSPQPLQVEGVANLPTYFAGLLPEGVMFTAVKNLIGSAADDLFAVLAATGSDAIGDIDVRIPGEPERKRGLDLAEATKEVKSLLEGKNLTSHVTAISGVQPKASLGEVVRASRMARYIAKFDSPQFPGLLENEYAITRLARFCRLNVSDTELRDDALVIKRFDRVYDREAKRMRKVHVEDMLQAMDLFPNSKYTMEYHDLMLAMQRLGVGRATLLNALELFVFSYIVGNGDLHAKNVSLVQDPEDGQWRLSPLYDLISTLPYLPDRMALALIDKNHGRYTIEEFVAFGERFGLPGRAVSVFVQILARRVEERLEKAVEGYLSRETVEAIAARAHSLAA